LSICESHRLETTVFKLTLAHKNFLLKFLWLGPENDGIAPLGDMLHRCGGGGGLGNIARFRRRRCNIPGMKGIKTKEFVVEEKRHLSKRNHDLFESNVSNISPKSIFFCLGCVISLST
jgi:hypothetical protein